MNLKVRLALMNFLEFAVWGAYLTSMGRYLGNVGMSMDIGWFYSMQGIVSIFMPALMGIIADRWIQAQRLLGLCHLMAGAFMFLAALYGMTSEANSEFSVLFTLYSVSVGFYMPTLALSNSVAYNALTKAGMDTVKDFPPIRVFGTIGFIVSMWFVNCATWTNDGQFLFSIDSVYRFQYTYMQLFVSGALGLLLGFYCFSLPQCPLEKKEGKKTVSEALGLNAFRLFKNRKMAMFFIFSMLLGMSLQVTNGFATPFITSFKGNPLYADTFGANNATLLTSLSQISEALCILLIPFFLKRYGIKTVMLIAMIAWVFRFGMFGLGDPGSGLWMFVTSMIVYGVAFDFFNVSGALFVERETDTSIQASAQGLFMLMTNGIGATVGTLAAGAVVDNFCQWQVVDGQSYLLGDWTSAWLVFAGYSLVVAFAFAVLFKYKHTPEKLVR